MNKKKIIYFSDISYEDQQGVLHYSKKKYPFIITKINNQKVFLNMFKVDTALHGLPRATAVKIDIVDDNGEKYSVDAYVATKKLPTIEIEVTDKIKPLGNARKHERVPVSIWCELMKPKRKGSRLTFKPYADCTIADISPGGIKIVTEQQLNLGDILIFSFFYEKVNHSVIFRGQVKCFRSAKYGLKDYGLAFYKPTPAFIETVSEILENPEEV